MKEQSRVCDGPADAAYFARLDREVLIDRAVQNRLQRSNRYRYAATAEEQALVEAEITAQVEADYA